jgi:hypothetical protein
MRFPGALLDFVFLREGRVTYPALQDKARTGMPLIPRRVTWHIRLPMGAIVRQMAELTPLENGGTHLSLREAGSQESHGDGAGANHHAACDGGGERASPQ